VVTIDDRMLLAISTKVTPDSRQIRKWECVQIIQRKRRKGSARRTFAKIVAGDWIAVWIKNRPSWENSGLICAFRILGGKGVSRRTAAKQFAEIAYPHLCCWNRDRLRIAGTAKDRRAVSLTVQ